MMAGQKGNEMRNLFERVRAARAQLDHIDPDKLAFVEEAHEAYTAEAARLNDELEFIGGPEQVKLDFISIAVEEGRMTGEEFEAIWIAVDLLELAATPC